VQRVQRTEPEGGELAGAGLDSGIQRHIDGGTVDPEGRCESAVLSGIRIVLDQMGGRADEAIPPASARATMAATAIASSRTRDWRWSSNGRLSEQMSR